MFVTIQPLSNWDVGGTLDLQQVNEHQAAVKTVKSESVSQKKLWLTDIKHLQKEKMGNIIYTCGVGSRTIWRENTCI